MIPAGLSATHVAFIAWRAATVPNLHQLSDDEVGGAYQALSALLRDVEIAYGEVRDQVIRRVIATNTREPS